MTHSVLSRTVAAAAVASFVALAAATSASAEEPTPANLSFGNATGTLTLPAGDGVRDTTDLFISSDLATTASVVVRDSVSFDVVKTLTSVELAGEGVSSTITIPVTDLSAGTFEVVATPIDGASIVTSLTVGSGEPQTVSLSLSAAKIFTWAKATPRTSVATVSATDETGLTVPFVGKVTATVGGKTYAPAVSSTTGASATASLPVTKFGVGTGTVHATVSGPSETSYASEPKTLSVLQTAVTSVTIKGSLTTVYPAKDTYRDTVKFTVTPKTTTGTAFASTGSVKITRSGKTVKSWTVTSSKTAAYAWDGKVAGKIVPGTYTITVSLKGPEGATKTAKTTVKVDSGKLVTKTKTVTYKASSVMKSYEAFDDGFYGSCYTNYYKTGDFYCYGWEAYYTEALSLIAYGKITLPSYVVSAEKYGASAKVYMTTSYLDGAAAWSYDTVEYGSARIGEVQTGKRTLGALSLNTSARSLYLSVGLGEYADIVGDSFSVAYTYKVMTH